MGPWWNSHSVICHQRVQAMRGKGAIGKHQAARWVRRRRRKRRGCHLRRHHQAKGRRRDHSLRSTCACAFALKAHVDVGSFQRALAPGGSSYAFGPRSRSCLVQFQCSDHQGATSEWRHLWLNAVFHSGPSLLLEKGRWISTLNLH